MNLPYLSIYKGDFLRQNVSGCSIAAQGLWLRLMILMHDGERPGYLSLNGEAMPPRLAASKCSVSPDEFSSLLSELEAVRAFSRSTEGILYSPQIVAEAQERARNAERQRRFKEGKKGNASVTPEVTEKKRGGNGLSSSSDTVPNGTGAVAPDLSDPAVMWDVGKSMLVRCGMTKANAGSLLGKLAGDYGRPKLAAALAQTVTANAANPKDYLIALLSREKVPRTQAELNRGGGGLVQ